MLRAKTPSIIMRNSFTVTNNPNPHALRSREMLKKYPQIKELMKPYAPSALYITLITTTLLGIGYYIQLKDLGIGWTLLLAYFIGAFLSHGLFVMIHESCHDGIWKSKFWNRVWGIISNIGQGFPSAMGFRTFHLLHHAHMNEYDSDADLAFHWEAKFVKNIWWRKVIWFLFFFAIEVARPIRLKKGKTFDKWVFFNIAFIVTTNALIYFYLGPKVLLFLILSSLFSVGLHPVGARWIQEHYTYKEGQETYDYYGPLNYIQFYIGYHNEHHDFYRVPWVHLPKIKKMAPEFYDNLYYHKSWTRLLLDFIFNPKRDLYQRIIRERGAKDRPQPKEFTSESLGMAK